MKVFTQNIIKTLESIIKIYLVFVWPTPILTNRMKMRFRDTYSSTNLYPEWEERLMTPIRSSKTSTSHTRKVGEMGRDLQNLPFFTTLMTWQTKTDIIPRSEKVMHIQFERIFVRFMVVWFTNKPHFTIYSIFTLHSDSTFLHMWHQASHMRYIWNHCICIKYAKVLQANNVCAK